MTNPITTGMLSFGMSGRVFHGPLLTAHPGFTLDAVVQRNTPTIKSYYPTVQVYNSVDKLLADKSIELVIVNLPNEYHYELTRQVLEAGKHAVVEKPFTLTVKEGSELIALAEKKNLVLSVFQNRRWDGDFLTVRKVVEGNLLGKLVEAELHYDRYRNFIDAGSWKEEAGRGAGNLYNLGSHMIDQALVLFGMPETVDARMGIHRPGGQVDDYFDIRMMYADKLVILKSSYLVREEGARYTLHGTAGSFLKYGLDPQEEALKAGGVPGSAGWGTEPSQWWGTLNTQVNGSHYRGKIETVPGNYLQYYDGVYKAIREKSNSAVSAEEGLAVIRIIEAAIESNEERKAIKVT